MYLSTGDTFPHTHESSTAEGATPRTDLLDLVSILRQPRSALVPSYRISANTQLVVANSPRASRCFALERGI